MLVDSHCHLADPLLAGMRDAVLDRARRAGVGLFVCCATRESDWDAVAALALRHAAIIPCFGIHPWFVAQPQGGWSHRLEQLLVSIPGAAVGEIGLDWAIEPRYETEQRELFLAQLALAKRLSRPVSIHCRKAWGVLLELLESMGPFESGGLIHSYSGSVELIPHIERLGLSLSLSGSITRPGNSRAHKAAAAITANRLLIETDSPSILPTGAPPGPNEPSNLTFVLESLAAIRGESVATLAEQTCLNARTLFRSP